MKNGKFDLRTFIKRALYITLTLALAEIAVIFFVMHDKGEKSIAKNEHSLTPATKPIQDSQSAQSSYNPIKTTGSDIDTNTNRQQNFLKEEKTATTVITPLAQDIKRPDSTVILTNKYKPAAVSKSKTLSKSEMIQVMNRVAAEKIRSDISIKCVQVQQTAGSNVSNAFAIAKFLRSKGYTISGRLTVPGHQAGIGIHAQGNCVVVVIGSL